MCHSSQPPLLAKLASCQLSSRTSTRVSRPWEPTPARTRGVVNLVKSQRVSALQRSQRAHRSRIANAIERKRRSQRQMSRQQAVEEKMEKVRSIDLWKSRRRPYSDRKTRQQLLQVMVILRALLVRTTQRTRRASSNAAPACKAS